MRQILPPPRSGREASPSTFSDLLPLPASADTWAERPVSFARPHVLDGECARHCFVGKDSHAQENLELRRELG